MSNNSNPNSTPKDAYGYDAMSTYLPIDNLGINALPDSEKSKKGIKENRTGRARTLGICMSCPNCGTENSRSLFQMIMGLRRSLLSKEVRAEAYYLYLIIKIIIIYISLAIIITSTRVNYNYYFLHTITNTNYVCLCL
jgi:hypothetical protein